MCTGVRDYRTGDSRDFPYHGIWFIVVVALSNFHVQLWKSARGGFGNSLSHIKRARWYFNWKPTQDTAENARKTRVRHDEGLEIIALFSFRFLPSTTELWDILIVYLLRRHLPSVAAVSYLIIRTTKIAICRRTEITQQRNEKKIVVDSIVSGFADCRQKDK